MGEKQEELAAAEQDFADKIKAANKAHEDYLVADAEYDAAEARAMDKYEQWEEASVAVAEAEIAVNNAKDRAELEGLSVTANPDMKELDNERL